MWVNWLSCETMMCEMLRCVGALKIIDVVTELYISNHQNSTNVPKSRQTARVNLP